MYIVSSRKYLLFLIIQLLYHLSIPRGIPKLYMIRLEWKALYYFSFPFLIGIMDMMDPNQSTPNIPVQPIQQPFAPQTSKPTPKFIFIIGGFVILFIGLSVGYILSKSSPSGITKSIPIDKACTQDAKICPDGSSVGRTGPNCEFAPCSQVATISSSVTPNFSTESSQSATANWKTYNIPQLNLIFKYPVDWFVEENDPGRYIRVQNYDPKSAPRRGYDPLIDKGMYLLTITPREGKISVTTIDELKNALSKNGDPGFYMGDSAGKIVIQNEKSYSINGFSAYYREVTFTDNPNIENETYLLDGKGVALLIFYGLDYTNGKSILDQILSTFKFL